MPRAKEIFPRATFGTRALCWLALNQGIFHLQPNPPKDDYKVNSLTVGLAAANDICNIYIQCHRHFMILCTCNLYCILEQLLATMFLM